MEPQQESQSQQQLVQCELLLELQLVHMLALRL
jgi:hypothetical protein